MNWTEGVLARHVPGGRGKQLLRRQRQHFAKARTGALNSTRRTSSSPRPPNPGSRPAPALHATHSPEPPEDRLADLAHGRPGGGDRSIADKKRKLLLKDDWTGVKIQKPLHHPSTSHRATPRLPPWPPHKDGALPRAGHVLERRYNARMKSSRNRHESSPALGDIRIRIGSQEARFGESSSMGRRASHREPPGTKQDDLTSSPYFQSSCKFILFLTWYACTLQNAACAKKAGGGGVNMSSSPCATPSRCLTQERRQAARRARRAGSSSSSLSRAVTPPVRRRIHQLVRSPLFGPVSHGSNPQDSTMAQVGPREPVVTASLQEENERWRDLMCSSPNTRMAGSNLSRPVVSPGVSALCDAIPSVRQTGLGRQGPSSHGSASDGSDIQGERHLGEYEDSSTGSAEQDVADQAPRRVPKIPPESMPNFSLPAHFLLSTSPTPSSDMQNDVCPRAESKETWPDVELPELHEKQQASQPFASNMLHTNSQLRGPVREGTKVRDKGEEHEAWMKSIVSDSSSEGVYQQALLEAKSDASRALQQRAQIQPARKRTPDAAIRGLPTKRISTADAAAREKAAAGSPASSSGASDIHSFVTTLLPSGFDEDCESDDSMQGNASKSGGAPGEYHAPGPTYPQTRDMDSVAAEPSWSGLFEDGEAPSPTYLAVPDIDSVTAEPSLTTGTTISTPADEPKMPFKFAAPKPFVRKHATHKPGYLSSGPALPLLSNQRQGRQRGARGRGAARKRSGQTVIRQLPNYYADPIEEFGDEETNAAKNPKSPPLFGALETE
ncbi:hypothetical protein RB600_004280 [Gaeumannomyces tritici]